MAIGGYASSSWQFSRLNNTNNRSSVFDTVNSNTSAKLGTTDEVDEEETIDVSNLSAKEIQLLEIQELEEFKAEMYDIVKDMVDNRTSSLLSASIYITDDAFQRMKDDPEFKDEVLNKIYDSVQPPAPGYIVDGRLSLTITDNVDDWEYIAYMVHPDTSDEYKDEIEKRLTNESSSAFYSAGLESEASDGLDFDEIWLEQLEYQETMRQQRELFNS